MGGTGLVVLGTFVSQVLESTNSVDSRVIVR
jgi:hypothetical protein